PFRATPKHFSFLAATAAATSAFVSGAAAAIVASAVVMAPARKNELTVYFADIVSPFNVGIAAWAKMHCFIRLVHGRYYTATAHGSVRSLQTRRLDVPSCERMEKQRLKMKYRMAFELIAARYSYQELAEF